MFSVQVKSISDFPQAQTREVSVDDNFKSALAAAIPPLRAYARLLSGNADTADDLVQETLVKAWVARDRFIAGSNIRAWTHVILRNVYFSQNRRARFKGEWNEFDADALLAVAPRQDSHVALGDLMRAMQQLPVEQRDALIMMGAGGMTCEEVAAVCDCAIGTIKSRVARARSALRTLLDGGQLTQRRADRPESPVSALDQIMHEAVTLGSGARTRDHSIAGR